MNRVGLYFFVLASLLSIIDGVFTIVSPELQTIKIILLIFSGILVGVFLFSVEKELLIAGSAFIISALSLLFLLGPYFHQSPIGVMILNFVIFVASIVFVVGFKAILESIGEVAGLERHKHEGVTFEFLKESSFEKIWGIVILVAVSFAIMQLLLEIFYDVSKYIHYLQALDLVITALFIMDVFMIYEKSKSFKQFLSKNFFDIIAAIPSVGLLRLFKIIRAIRLVRIFKASSKLTAFFKIHKTTKFFSEESAIKHYTKSVKKPKKKKPKTLKRKSKSKK